MKQLRLDDVGRDYPTDSPVEDLVERFRGAILGLAVGDALGWPNEFPGHRTKPATRFIEWEKLVGGRFWGYRDRILPGEYSDDTQLTLALARSVLRTGGLDVEKFAYEELPLWLQYERGGADRSRPQHGLSYGRNPPGPPTSSEILTIGTQARTAPRCGHSPLPSSRTETSTAS
jgi:ADP-ribosylglycohydrolase